MRDYAGILPIYLDLDLLSAGWNGTISPYPGMDDRTFAMQSLRKSFLKKYQDQKSNEADLRALDLFLQINEKCKTFDLVNPCTSEIEAIALGEAKDYIFRFFQRDPEDALGVPEDVLTLGQIGQNFGLGNGANIGSPGTSFLQKVGLGTMAATSSTLHYFYMEAISEDALWSDVESVRRVKCGTELVRGSRLSFVPKTTEISRTICTEPVCNMLFQKGIGAVLEKRLREVSGIDLSTQPNKNRLLARLGSQTGEFGTIDLSSASDSMSLGLVREFFPRSVVSLLEMARSPLTILPDGTKVELHMVSSMGNAYTFPLQTLFFSAIVYGVYRARGIKLERPSRHSLGNFAVFGDDIIVRKEAYDLVCRLLSLCGFSVNIDKSFNEGLFRESCGHDYYHGYNVRGVYIKTLKDVCDRYSAINRLNVWSAQHGILLTNTISYLLKGCRLLPIPFDEMDTAGVKVPFAFLRSPLKCKATGGFRYRYLHILQDFVSVTDVQRHPPLLRGWFNNPSAIMLGALAGTFRAGKVSNRLQRRLTRIKARCSSRWDYIPPDLGLGQDFGNSWKTVVELNLNF